MILKRMTGAITGMRDLSPSAKEVRVSLSEPLGFTPGAFVNVFMLEEGKKTRRAYSIASSQDNQKEIALMIRKGSPGGMSERFWEPNISTVPLEIMGPLGLNTADKIEHPRVFLFAFGIGVSVIKGVLHYLLSKDSVTEVTVVTGSRHENEILCKEFFEEEQRRDPRLTLRFVVSQPTDATYPWKGHIQDYIDDFSFENSSVYICGTSKACNTLKEAIEKKSHDVQFLIEAFD